ncbi:glycoside hydrolase family 3 N-terminal domain-containing protein [Acidothermaceae bacterium B102]|nr:glycoside hydrolase family 3 N-terminal domain-containing protein [Acidothermaceae bacterium B102]
MSTASTTGTWRDERLTPANRAELLLAEMTVAEKCHQLTARMAWSFVRADGTDSEDVEQVLRNPPGHVAQLILDDPEKLAAMVGTIQHQVLTRSRLGVPVLFHAEALSGFLAGGHMVFPSGTGLAAGWSPDLVEEMSDLIRRQMRRTGLMHALSPVLDVALDPRWGRVHETFGEDPYLCAAMGVAYVRGLQGSDLTHGVMATGKHFLGYAAPPGGMNMSAFESGGRRTRDVFAYPFEAAIRLAGLRSVMNSYADVDGVPAGASPEVLQGLLRDALGFDGFVSSDYTTLQQLVDRQRVAATAAQAGRLAIQAGLDVELPTPYGYGDVLAAEVERGAADLRQVDLSVWRVLKAKFEVGLFERPYPTERIDVAAVAQEGAELSQELSRRSIVLAKNDGLLPLTPGALDIAVIGPHADAPSLQFPTYTYASWREASEAVMRGELGTMNGAEETVAAWYTALFEPQDGHSLVQQRYDAKSLSAAIESRSLSVRAEPGCTVTTDLGDEAISRAVQAATAADVVVLALGGASLWFTGERTEGEASDTADITLPRAQVRLAEAVAATGTPMVVVLVQGRAYALPPVVQDAAAILVAPYAGAFGNRSIADILFGTVNPSGKLPYSLPRHSGQIPVYHHQPAGSGYRSPLPPSTPRHYLDLEGTPLWPFAHGLSYTTFLLTDLDAGPGMDTDGACSIGLTVTNDGDRAGATVIQLYLRCNTFGVTRPAQQLAGFARVHLKIGESRRVTFELQASQLAYTNLAREMAVEPCTVDIFVGLDSNDRSLSGSFELTGEARVVSGKTRSFLSHAAVQASEHERVGRTT